VYPPRFKLCRLRHTSVTKRHKQFKSLLQFHLDQNNKLMLHWCDFITVIMRWQPVMFYPELFTYSDTQIYSFLFQQYQWRY